MSATQHRYWRKNLRITGLLLAIWLLVTFAGTYFARELSFIFFGWPFSFWLASQGALIIYVLLISFYAYYMNRLDQAFDAAETAGE